ncbi:3-ketoacyl-ACP reductase [Pseudooceanicola sp. CBS1P-1]|uniref:3-ketoacyl-ACP reductase n=1 Tax=Pseudooceanicola albus TaxID=2692189 RepID=A0A6L7G9X8_9RHOB|nr:MULTISPECIES: 3-ketoacyl-ACP reductase [Pseudooceanicola]MBT9386026.1 3-ketoacyl-ACP reductase [Pseudooceanicola endophyticus]MXN19553.1 3-ketoacyl-ACP reductase [Pseudooceanicola albus]
MTRPVALVTGARQGLGRGIALALADRGFDVAGLDLLADEKSESLLEALAAKGAKAHFGVMDLADLSAHAPALEAVEAALGPVDALVNNAGIAARPLTDLLEIAPEAFDRNLSINLRGTFFLTQAVAKRMLARDSTRYRSITFIASIAATHVSTDRSPYCVSKAGLSMVTQLYADRLGPAGIAVHEIRPGFIRTEMTGSAPTGKIDAYVESGAVAMKRWGETADIGRVAATLAAGDLPYVTGQPIYVDGGYHIPTA